VCSRPAPGEKQQQPVTRQQHCLNSSSPCFAHSLPLPIPPLACATFCRAWLTPLGAPLPHMMQYQRTEAATRQELSCAVLPVAGACWNDRPHTTAPNGDRLDLRLNLPLSLGGVGSSTSSG